MKIFAVIGGFNHEGQDVYSLKLFENNSNAESYAKELEQELGYDYSITEEQEVM